MCVCVCKNMILLRKKCNATDTFPQIKQFISGEKTFSVPLLAVMTCLGTRFLDVS